MVTIRSFVTPLSAPARAALAALLPPQCMACGGLVEADAALCADCWNGLELLGPPHCPCCGYPFEFDMGDAVLCGHCLRRPPSFDRARAALAYNDMSRRLVLNFKHGDRLHMTPGLARLMAGAGADLLAETEAIVPVPLHWRRLVRRRYNQAAELARQLARLSDVPLVTDAVRRTRPTPTQGRLSPAARRRNVRGAFQVAPHRRDALRGRRVLLVDDVLTTGATVEAVTRTLRRAGVGAVDVLVLARVVRPQYE